MKPEVHVIWEYGNGIAEPLIIDGQAVPGNRETLMRLVDFMIYADPSVARPEFFFLAPLPDEYGEVAPVSHTEVFGHV